eukprot:c25238_g1_i2 orf=500-1621(-)
MEMAHSCEDFCTSTVQEPSTEASEPFICRICLDLVYKPVVQACGHIFCFWCAFNAMDCQRQSQCPICQWPYMYFPRVCTLLHFMLMKAIPEKYERRSHEIQLEEEEKQVFSPTLLGFAKTCRVSIDNVVPYSQNGDASNDASTTCEGNNEHHNILGSSQTESVECAEGDVGCAQRNTRNTGSVPGILTVDDFCCALCNGLLYRPVVLNCGEAFCESCLKNSTTSKVLQCPSCRAPHPGGSVLICLELHQYLESAFPTEYSKKQLLQQQAENSQSLDYVGDYEAEGYFHEGVGCDGCGMFPIMGNRYKCKECTEMNRMIGFDLCGSCYASSGSLMGRFSQEHRANHHMELVKQDYTTLLPTERMIATTVNSYVG